MPRFDRVYELIAGQGGQSGVSITGLRIRFDISKTSSKNPNRSRIDVFNLALETRRAMEKPDTRCVLKAGYAEEGGPLEVFQGEVVEGYSTYDRADVVTTLELGEGAVAIRDGMVSLGYPRGVTARQALADVAQQMGLALMMPEDAPNRTWENGLSFHGAARSALDRITAGSGMAWSIQGGGLQVVRAGGATNRTVFDLRADSGLIGTPERERRGAREAASLVTDQTTNRPNRVESTTDEKTGWRVRSLLLPSVMPADRVKLSSRTVDGVFVVEELRHVGDTHGGDWVTELKLVEPRAAGDQREQRPAGRTQARQTPSRPANRGTVTIGPMT